MTNDSKVKELSSVLGRLFPSLPERMRRILATAIVRFITQVIEENWTLESTFRLSAYGVKRGNVLARTLRSAREKKGLTAEQVAQRTRWSVSKINRIETGQVSISYLDLEALLNIYGITDPGRRQSYHDVAEKDRHDRLHRNR